MDLVKMVDFLFNFWKENAENICDYCVYTKTCGGRACKYYTEFEASPELKRFMGEDYIPTCMDMDFGECGALEHTPCHGCTDTNMGHFKWNGKFE